MNHESSGWQGRIEGRGAWSRVEGSSLGELLPNLAWLLERGALGLGAGGGSSSPPCLHSTGELGSSAGSLSVTIGVRHLAATRKSGITQETEIVAQQLHRPGATFGGPALNLVHKPNFWCNIPADCNAINFILAPMTSFCASHLPLEGFVRNPGAGVFCSKCRIHCFIFIRFLRK